MTTGLLDPTMATDKPQLMSVKIPMDVLSSARIVAAYRGTTMTDLLAEILRPTLAKMEQEEIALRNLSINEHFAKGESATAIATKVANEAARRKAGKK